MADEEAKPAEQIKIEKTTGVARDANAWDKTTVAGVVSGGGLAVYLAFVVIPGLTAAIEKNTAAMVAMQAANEAHYRAMSDDRRTQFDQISAKINDAARTAEEIRKDLWRLQARPGDPLPKGAAPDSGKRP